METRTSYLDLNINQRINLKGYAAQKDSYFGTVPKNYIRIRWFAWMDEVNEKMANELLFFRSTPRGYVHY